MFNKFSLIPKSAISTPLESTTTSALASHVPKIKQQHQTLSNDSPSTVVSIKCSSVLKDSNQNNIPKIDKINNSNIYDIFYKSNNIYKINNNINTSNYKLNNNSKHQWNELPIDFKKIINLLKYFKNK